jgi:hypothetical protein
MGSGPPFTQYVNKSEILPVVLLVLVVAWTWMKVMCRGERAKNMVAAMDPEKS